MDFRDQVNRRISSKIFPKFWTENSGATPADMASAFAHRVATEMVAWLTGEGIVFRAFRAGAVVIPGPCQERVTVKLAWQMDEEGPYIFEA